MSKEGERHGSAVGHRPEHLEEAHLKISIHRLAAEAAALALAASMAPSHAQSPAPLPAATLAQTAQPDPVVVIVRVPKPWYAPRMLVVGKMRDTIPQYAILPGLMFKAFSFEQDSGDFGGLYHWRDRASADAWFNRSWFERVRKERNVDAQVRFFDAPVTIENLGQAEVMSNTELPGNPLVWVPFPRENDSKAVGTLVEIPIPAGVTRERLVAEFKAAIPTYQKVPGLLRKHFTISDQGSFGGVYLWRNEASARAWFGDSWHARVIKTYGQDAKLEWFDTPILMPSQDPATLASARALIVTTP